MDDTLRDPRQLFSVSSEAAVLGSMLLDTKCIPEVLAIITRTEMFYSLPTRNIFDSIIALHLKGLPTIDAVLLRNELVKRKQLDDVGGVEFIKEILNSVPSSANAEYYAKIVREKYQYRLMLQVIQQINEVPDEALDVNEQIARIQELALSMEQEREIKAFTFDDAAESVMALADKRHHITSGFWDLDRIIGGFYNNELIVVAGRPGMGKSCFCGDIAVHLAQKGKKTIQFSLEMSAESIIQRAVCATASVDGNRWRGDVPQVEFDKALQTASEISNYSIVIYETVETARQMYSIVSAAQRTGKVDAIVVDNVQLMRTDPYIAKEYERLTSISRNLKKITQVLKVPVLAISHLNREVDKRDKHRPRLSDLRGSGSIEQDADIVLLLHREDQYRIQTDPDMDPNDFDGITELIVAKNRRGRTGVAKLLFLEQYTHFVDLAVI